MARTKQSAKACTGGAAKRVTISRPNALNPNLYNTAGPQTNLQIPHAASTGHVNLQVSTICVIEHL
jgi:hypothetical protein